MMPERIAKTDPNTQITDPTGSGPFRFVPDERVPGSRSVYARFEDYKPRTEGTTSFLAGPRVVHFDRSVWIFQPDAATAAAALTKGEFDWWENPSIDLVSLLRRDRDLVVEVKNRMGSIGCIRFNHLFPPFNNVAIRQLVLACVNQDVFMQAVAGAEPELYHTKVGLFTPGMPMATEAGTEALTARTDFDNVKRQLAAAGYNGEKIVLLGPSTVFSTHAESQVADDLLRRMGFNVDYQSLEWGTVVQRRASKEPPDKGGWHIFITNLTSLTNVFVPAHIAIRGGPTAWFGWPDVPKLEALREDWLNATTTELQKRLAAEIQTQFFHDVTHVPLGQFFQPAAFNKGLVDIQPGWPVMHSVRRA
jgi:peptide/nickel transport system substrate-binding protein